MQSTEAILTCHCNFSQLRGAGLGCGEVVGRAEEEHVGRRRRLHRRVQEHRERRYRRREQEPGKGGGKSPLYNTK